MPGKSLKLVRLPHPKEVVSRSLPDGTTPPFSICAAASVSGFLYLRPEAVSMLLTLPVAGNAAYAAFVNLEVMIESAGGSSFIALPGA